VSLRMRCYWVAAAALRGCGCAVGSPEKSADCPRVALPAYARNTSAALPDTMIRFRQKSVTSHVSDARKSDPSVSI